MLDSCEAGIAFSNASVTPILTPLAHGLPDTPCLSRARQAGIAFSNASVTLIHGMSRPLGAAFHIPHGMCNAMLMPRVTAFSARGAMGRYADAARLMGLCAGAAGDEEAAMGIPAALQAVASDLQVPLDCLLIAC